jgi:microcystin-dependent protein
MADYFLGEIRLFAYDWPPNSWALCNGASLPIQQNQALYALLGGQYGPSSATAFSLPDLRGRVPVHIGPGYAQGQYDGAESVALAAATVPPHNHAFQAVNAAGTVASPQGAMLAQSPSGHPAFTPLQQNGSTTLIPASLDNAGGSAPHENMQPFAVMNFCVSLQGIFPMRP